MFTYLEQINITIVLNEKWCLKKISEKSYKVMKINVSNYFECSGIKIISN